MAYKKLIRMNMPMDKEGKVSQNLQSEVNRYSWMLLSPDPPYPTQIPAPRVFTEAFFLHQCERNVSG